MGIGQHFKRPIRRTAAAEATMKPGAEIDRPRPAFALLTYQARQIRLESVISQLTHQQLYRRMT